MPGLKRIHVNPSNIASNVPRSKKRPLKPPMVVVTEDGIEHVAFAVEICGPSKVVYMPHDPLPSGARLWIETDGKVMLDGTTTLE